MCAKPLFSIVMPVFNSSEFLSASISSVLNQSFPHWELLAVDDGSTDSSPSILEYYSRLDPRIKVIPNIYRPGAVGARNTAISVSTGKYISFLDSDDLWGTHVLKTQLEAFSSGEVLLHSNINVIDRHSKFLHMITYPRRVFFSHLLLFNFMPNLSVSFSVECFGKPVIPEFPSRNDYAYWLKLLNDKPSLSSFNYGSVGSSYRKTGTGLSSSSYLNRYYMYLRVVSSFRPFIFVLPASLVYLVLCLLKSISPRLFSNFFRVL